MASHYDHAAYPELTPATCRAMRAWLGWKQADLAARTGLSIATLAEFERAGGKWNMLPDNRRLILRAFQNAGVRVLMTNGEIRGLRFTEMPKLLMIRHAAPDG